MAIDKVKKIYLLGYKEAEENIASTLQELGVIEISEFLPEYKVTEDPTGQERSRDLEKIVDQIEYIIDILNKLTPRKGFFGGMAKERISLSQEELEEIVESKILEESYSRCRELEKELGEIRSKRSSLDNDKQRLLPWIPVDIKLSHLESTETVKILIGEVPLKNYNEFREGISAVTQEVFLHQVITDSKTGYVVLLYSGEYQSSIENVLKEFEFAPFAYPLEDQSPEEIVNRIEKDLDGLKSDEERVRQSYQSILPKRLKLMALYDYYSNLLSRENTRLFLARTGESFCVTGWIPAREILRVKKAVEEKFIDVEIYFSDPKGSESVPVLLKNSRIVEPFEVVTDLYGRPDYHGIDPTPYLSIFYALFFGFCLTDAGYGIVLMILTGLLLWKSRAEPGAASRKFYRLFFLGGAASIFLGAIVGGWFGVTIQWKLIDPLEDLLVFFGMALALGVIHIFTGLTIKMAKNIQENGWAAGFYDQGLWILIISSLISMALVKANLLPGDLYPLARVCSLGAALGIVFFQGRQADKNVTALKKWKKTSYNSLWIILTISLTFYLLGIQVPHSRFVTLAAFLALVVLSFKNLKAALARIGLGLYSFYGISGYLGDTLSYSRLLALGLTTGIVAMIINKMAGISMIVPYVGWLMALIILLAGHAFNLVINLLGAFVHSCRLQYVEFFTKFYEAGGRAFKPFQLRNKYMIMKN